MFSKSKAEARYLAAARVLDEEFILFLTEKVARDFESPLINANVFAHQVVDGYLDELFMELPKL